MICSTITLRHLPLEEALDTIAGLGFTEIDLGALPGVCNHVPYELTADAVREVAEVVGRSGLAVRSVNADVGDLNRPLDAEERPADGSTSSDFSSCARPSAAPDWCCPTAPSSTSRSSSSTTTWPWSPTS